MTAEGVMSPLGNCPPKLPLINFHRSTGQFLPTCYKYEINKHLI